MPKKRKSKTSSTRKKSPKRRESIETKLIENIIELQKVHTNLAEKFDKLSNEISNLLALFELTAKNFAKQAPAGEFEKDKTFLEKIDKLLDQNKTIAKGLTLMEDKLRQRVYGSTPEKKEKKPDEEFQPSITTENRPLPRF
jgi:hypothetical protein